VLERLLSMLLVLLLLGAHQVTAGEKQVPAKNAPGAHRFGKFCESWLGKLRKRERDNRKSAKVRKTASGVVISWIGYGDRALQCKARSSRAPGTQFIGKLKYNELGYERRGSSRRAALKAKPVVVTRTEVLEIFRHDGSRWIY